MMPELSMHIMDIIENGISAGAYHIDLFIEEYIKKNLLKITIIDNGKGMDVHTIEKALEAAYSTKEGKGWGFGIPLFKQTAEQCNGYFDITSKEKMFTKVVAEMELSNIDRPPFGDLVGTIVSIVTGHPDIDLYMVVRKEDNKYEFDTRIIREVIGDINLATPSVLEYIRKDIEKGLEEIEFVD
ncbi:MAG: ATP-binding protein [Kosmotoga sp.]|nr:MAG: ATP-binding protein [Kosmotoga sp.]